MATKAKRRAAKRARLAKAKAVPAQAVAVVGDGVDLEAQARARVKEELAALSPKPWFLLRVFGSESSVETALREHRFEAYLPRETVKGTRRTSLRPVKVMRPLFHGYMFVVVDRDAGQRFDQVIAAGDGVVAFLTPCGSELPRPVRAGYVEELRLMETHGLFDRTEQTARAIKVDDLVEITSGKFRGHFAQVLRARPGDKRIRLLLDFLNGSATTTVNVAVEHVEPADPARVPKAA